MLHKESPFGGRKSQWLSIYIQSWACYMHRDGGTGLAMVPFGALCQSAVADFTPKWRRCNAHAQMHRQEFHHHFPFNSRQQTPIETDRDGLFAECTCKTQNFTMWKDPKVIKDLLEKSPPPPPVLSPRPQSRDAQIHECNVPEPWHFSEAHSQKHCIRIFRGGPKGRLHGPSQQITFLL